MSIYLDNATTTFPKPSEIISAMVEFSKDCGMLPTNLYLCQQAQKSKEVISDAKHFLSQLVPGTNPDGFHLTYGATNSLEKLLPAMLNPGDRIIISQSDSQPIQNIAHALEAKGMAVTRLPFDEEFSVNQSSLEKVISKSKAVILSHCNNITGSVIQADEIGKICEKAGSHFILDASNTIGAYEIDAIKTRADAILMSGHKHLFTHTGIGAVWIKKDLSDTIHKNNRNNLALSQILEPSTPNLIGAVSLLSGLKFVVREGVQRIRQHHLYLRESLLQALDMVKEVVVYARDAYNGAGIVSMSVNDMPSNTVSRLLEERYGIIVGSGMFGNEGTIKALKAYPSGVLRVSVGFFNTVSDIEYFATSLARMVGKR